MQPRGSQGNDARIQRSPGDTQPVSRTSAWPQPVTGGCRPAVLVDLTPVRSTS